MLLYIFDHMELEVEMAVSSVWVQGIEPCSSVRAADDYRLSLHNLGWPRNQKSEICLPLHPLGWVGCLQF